MTSRGWLKKQAADSKRAATAKQLYAQEQYLYANKIAWERFNQALEEEQEPRLITVKFPDGDESVFRADPEARERTIKWVRIANHTEEKLKAISMRLDSIVRCFVTFIEVAFAHLPIDVSPISPTALNSLPAFKITRPLEYRPQVQTTAPNA